MLVAGWPADVQGADITASGTVMTPGTIAPDHPIHVVKAVGANAYVDTITPPTAGFRGPLYLIEDTSTGFGVIFLTGGNVDRQQSIVGVMLLVYDGTNWRIAQ